MKLLAKPGNVGNMPSDGVIFNGSLCDGRVGAGAFSDTLDIGESYALGSIASAKQRYIQFSPVLIYVEAQTSTT
jgi:hypothetical protein